MNGMDIRYGYITNTKYKLLIVVTSSEGTPPKDSEMKIVRALIEWASFLLADACLEIENTT